MPPARRSAAEWEKAADAYGYEPYDPLNRVSLGRSVESALMARPLTPLDKVPPFWGSGIYSLYAGAGADTAGLYAPLVGTPAPVYVGQARARGARKGLEIADIPERSRALWSRVDEHRASVEQAADLDVQVFLVRWLVSDELFVPMAEALMINTYLPVWNRVVGGFGNHDPGAGRRQQARSQWDTLHPGRSWAVALVESVHARPDLARLVTDHLKAHPPQLAPAVPPVPSPGTADLLRPDEPDDGPPEAG